MSSILIIDDEQEMVELLSDELTERGHTVWTAFNGEDGIAQAAKGPDLIILDIMMPGRDGFDVCRTIRDRVSCPILFVSAKQSENDRVRGFSLGGDDYITKPYGLQELLARIEANLRREQRIRQQAGVPQGTLLRWGLLELDLKGMMVTVSGTTVDLTRKEYEIVELLALHPGQVFAREQIYERIWGWDAEGDAATVVEHVKRIRAKLASIDEEGEYIQTVWGIGYKWKKRPL